MRGFECSSKVDLNVNFFVSIIRNQEFGCLLRGSVAGCITDLLLRDAESFKGPPDPWMIIDRKSKEPRPCPPAGRHRTRLPKSIIGIFPKKRFCQVPFSVWAWDSRQDIPEEKNHEQTNFSVSS